MFHLTKRNRFSFPLIALLVANLLTMSGASTQTVSPAVPLNHDGALDMSTDSRGMLDPRGWEVILYGERPHILNPALYLVAYLVTNWNTLPNQGLDGYVHTLAAVGRDLYVGGDFTQTSDRALTNLGNIVRYDTTTDTWNALPNQGLDSGVYTLAVVGSDLYVGGAFTQTGDGALTNLGNIVRYDTTTDMWNTLTHQGLDNTVLALAVSNSDLYVGGYFTQTGDGTRTNLGCITRYNTMTGVWNALPNQGVGGGYYPTPSVRALAASGSDLYVGGNFTRSGDGTLTDLGRIVRYHPATSTWNTLPNHGLGGADVLTLAMIGSDLYVGGSFIQTGDGTLTNLGRIVRYDTKIGIWNALPNYGLGSNDVNTLHVISSDLYVGGSFTQTGDGTLTNLGHIARYDTTTSTWNALPNEGLDDDVRALAVVGNNLYVGGDFTQTGDGALANLGYITYVTSGMPEIAVYLPLVGKR